MRIAHPKDRRSFRLWPIALAGFALAAAGLACSASSLGGGILEGLHRPFRRAGESIVCPSGARSLPERPHALISAAGGTIEATGSDGTRFTLSVPEGALPLSVEISLTPLARSPTSPG